MNLEAAKAFAVGLLFASVVALAIAHKATDKPLFAMPQSKCVEAIIGQEWRGPNGTLNKN